jgi:hypothetical protein
LRLSIRFECAVSSVVEHYLDTVGVAGSNPASRTILFTAAKQGEKMPRRNRMKAGKLAMNNPPDPSDLSTGKIISIISDTPAPAGHPRDPLHGVTLESILNQLVQRHGWGEMGRRIPIRCFQFNPTVKSSLTFLRKTPWARQRVEDWFIGEL